MRNSGKEAPVTAKEIGRRLGLSQPTVSRILSGANGHRVSPETRQRVVDAAAAMGYRPNALARSLRQGRTNIVGFYNGYGYLNARNPFQAELIGGIQRAADHRRMDVLLHGVFRGVSTDDIFGELMDGRIDGLFINTSADDLLVARLRDSSLPVVAIADAVPGIPSVVVDDAVGVRLLLDFLWERGHRRIAYVYPIQRFFSVEQRIGAFREWINEAGRNPDEFPLFESTFEESGPALAALLALPPEKRPTAVCCWNDLTAFDLIFHCKQQGIRVPDDLAVVGFDGLLADPRLNVRALTTVGASWTDIADSAMNLLQRQMESGRRSPMEREENIKDGNLDLPSLLRHPVTLIAGDTV